MKIASTVLFCTAISGLAIIAGNWFPQKSIPSIHRHAEKDCDDSDSKQDADHLFPYELFYLDRNYPDYNASPDLFHKRLNVVIHADKSSARSHRGLDYPWTVEGPGNIGGRINTIAVHPLNPDIILMGYSQGGIYRTENGGVDWKPVFDDQISLAVSHIAFDPHDPNRVFATTGDVNISGYPFVGSGIYRSDDAGLHWFYTGLDDTGVLSKVAIDPNDANIIYVGSMGYPSHKSDAKGFFRSVDGGHNWTKTLTIDDSTGVIDLVTDPTRPGYVYASGWTRIRSSTISTTLGPGTSMYRSKDFGATWENILDILPASEHSRTSVEITFDGTLFLSYLGYVESGDCSGYIESLIGIYKSLDGGTTWEPVTADPSVGLPCELFGSFGWYTEALKVNPNDANDISLLGVDMYRTLNGGETWFLSAPEWWTYEVHADKHDLVFAAGQMFLATDGGAYSCPVDQSLPWRDIENIPSTQFYRTTFNPHQPDQYIGGAQDNGTSSGNESIINEWPRLFGGDGFQPRFDPSEPLWAYYMTQNGEIYWTPDGGNFELLDKGIIGRRYWDMPFIMSSQDPKILFCGSSELYRIDMRDTSHEWIPISPDLTRGEFILGNRYPSITAIAQSDLDEMRLYAGTQDGKIWTSPDGGMNWKDITDGTPGFYVTSITCSTKNPQGVIATYSGYRDNDHTPYIYRSNNAGELWTSLGSNVPMLGVNNLIILPGWNDEVLFAATDGGVYVSFNAGFSWDRLGTNFPYMPVYDIDYNPVENTIVAATFSRGLMTFPVEELDLVSAVESIPDRNIPADISVYPTFVTEEITLDFMTYSGNERAFQVSIFDLGGIVIREFNIALHTKNRKFKLKIDEDFPTGFYIGIISDFRSVKTSFRFIKK